MNVVSKFPEDMDARTTYKLLKAPAKKMSEAVDSVLEVKAWLAYEDADANTGEIREVLTVETIDGERFATVSSIFRREFFDIVEYFGKDVGAITVIGGTSRTGRNFITCSVV